MWLHSRNKVVYLVVAKPFSSSREALKVGAWILSIEPILEGERIRSPMKPQDQAIVDPLKPDPVWANVLLEDKEVSVRKGGISNISVVPLTKAEPDLIVTSASNYDVIAFGADKNIITRPAIQRVAPPFSVSLPVPPIRTSFPSSPVRTSSPSPPTSISFPAPPRSSSLPLPPDKMSLPSPPNN